MIVYNLMCEQQHRFEGWFDSGEDFAAQRDSGQVECPLCNSKLVRKVPAGSYVKTTSGRPAEVEQAEQQSAYEAVRRKVIEYIQQHTEDVGPAFAETVSRCTTKRWKRAACAAKRRHNRWKI